jgi:hypothetical protein
MKRLTLITLPLLFAAYLKLYLNNPAPRVSDELGIEFQMGTNGVLDRPEPGMNAVGTIKLNNLRSDSGWVWIGPFSMSIDGVVYKTDSVHLWIAPNLPAEETGFWMRQVESDGRQLLILEQRMPLKQKVGKGSDRGTTEITWTAGDEDFASIDQASLEGTGVFMDFKYSQSNQQTIRVNNGLDYLFVYYKFSVYEIHKSAEFKGELELKRKHFVKFPSGVPLETIMIR